MRTGLLPDRDLARRQALYRNLNRDRGLVRDLKRNRNRGVLGLDRWQALDSGMV